MSKVRSSIQVFITTFRSSWVRAFFTCPGSQNGYPDKDRDSRDTDPTAILRDITTRYRYSRFAITTPPPPHPTPSGNPTILFGNKPDMATGPDYHVPANEPTRLTFPRDSFGKRNQDFPLFCSQTK